jgi:hypothetical protein
MSGTPAMEKMFMLVKELNNLREPKSNSPGLTRMLSLRLSCYLLRVILQHDDRARIYDVVGPHHSNAFPSDADVKG